MPHCAALGCNFQSKGNKGTDVSLHVFPNDKRLRKQWEDACGRTELPKDPRLCSRHFTPDAFEAFNRPQLLKDLTGTAGFKRRLKPDAVPTVFPDREANCTGMSSENREKKRETKPILQPHIMDPHRTSTDQVLFGCWIILSAAVALMWWLCVSVCCAEMSGSYTTVLLEFASQED